MPIEARRGLFGYALLTMSYDSNPSWRNLSSGRGVAAGGGPLPGTPGCCLVAPMGAATHAAWVPRAASREAATLAACLQPSGWARLGPSLCWHSRSRRRCEIAEVERGPAGGLQGPAGPLPRSWASPLSGGLGRPGRSGQVLDPVDWWACVSRDRTVRSFAVCGGGLQLHHGKQRREPGGPAGGIARQARGSGAPSW